MLLELKINPIIKDDLTKWWGYNTIKKLSCLTINKTKEKDPGNFQFKIKARMRNIYLWGKKLRKKIQVLKYRY